MGVGNTTVLVRSKVGEDTRVHYADMKGQLFGVFARGFEDIFVRNAEHGFAEYRGSVEFGEEAYHYGEAILRKQRREMVGGEKSEVGNIDRAFRSGE